jgi:hypothetical protein
MGMIDVGFWLTFAAAFSFGWVVRSAVEQERRQRREQVESWEAERRARRQDIWVVDDE